MAADTGQKLNNKPGEASFPEGYDPDQALRLDNQLCFPLYAASRKIVSAYTPLLKPLGLTYTQYITFMVLWEEDGISVGELCRKLRLDSGTVTPLLKKMEKAGYIVRSRSPKDERVVIVSLTDEGRGMKEKAAAVPLKMAGCINMDPEKAIELKRLLEEIIQS